LKNVEKFLVLPNCDKCNGYVNTDKQMCKKTLRRKWIFAKKLVEKSRKVFYV
jgi:hypothetical protein